MRMLAGGVLAIAIGLVAVPCASANVGVVINGDNSLHITYDTAAEDDTGSITTAANGTVTVVDSAGVTNKDQNGRCTVNGPNSVSCTSDLVSGHFSALYANYGNGTNTINPVQFAGDSTFATLQIYGGTGQDVMRAAQTPGYVTLNLGDGNNQVATTGDGGATITAGDGSITVNAGDGVDDVTLGHDDGTVTTGSGGDPITATGGSLTVNSGGGNDSVTLSGGGGDTVNGGAGNDTITTGTGNDTVNAGDGDDTVHAESGGSDILNGGAGVDHLYAGDAGGNTLNGGADNDVLTGGDLADTLNGNDGNDTLSSGLGDDTLDGGPGDDTLNGSYGADDISGGTGVDDLNNYVNATDPVTITEDDVANDGDVAHDHHGDNIHDDIEKVELGSAADSFTGSGIDNVVYGGDGDDHLDGGGGDDILYGYPTTPDNHDGNDTLGGGTGDDQLNGGAGNDTLNGDDGNDLLSGGDGDDTIHGGENDDTIPWSPGDDVVDGGPGTLDSASYAGDTVGVHVSLDGVANDGEPNATDNVFNVEQVTGTSHDDVITGDDAVNYLYGADGKDQLDGRGGFDVLRGGNGDDTVTGRDDALQTDDLGCDEGSDTAIADAADEIEVGCENVDRSTAPAGFTPTPPGTTSPQIVTVTVPATATPAPAVGTVTATSGATPSRTTPPKLTISGVPSSTLTLSKLLRGFTIAIRLDEAATLDVSLRATTTKATLASTTNDLTLVRHRYARSAATRRVTLKPPASLLNLRRHHTTKLTIYVVATDAFGNTTTATPTVKVRS